jgi:peptide/nickel transport system substrate-binding protein
MKKAAGAAALALFATACGAGTPETGPVAADTGGTFTYAIPADPGVLDPAQGVLSITNSVLSFAYDTLVRAGDDGKVVPGLAEKWDVKPDSVTFTLRKDVTCSDGTPLTAEHVAGTVNHITDPKTKSPVNGVLVPAGMKAEASGDHTVTLSTPEPFAFILESARDVFIVCGKGLEDRSLLARGTSGSGPYVLGEAVPGDHYTFKVRRDYAWGHRGTGKDLPEQVVLRVVPNEQTAANMLVAGTINGAQFLGPDRARLESTPGIGKILLPVGNGQFFYHQGKGRPGADPAVRKALTQALNLTELGGIASGGTGQPATGLVSEPRPCPGDTVSGHVPAFDEAAAAAALDAAGWTKGADGIRAKDGERLTLRLLYATTRGPGIQAAAEYMAAAWKKAGVEVKLNGVLDTKLAESLNATQDWDVVWLPITVTLPSQLVGFLSGPAAPDGANFAHLKNEQYTKLVTEAIETPGEQGCALWLQAESALFDNADLIPVVANNMLVATKNAEFTISGGLFDPSSIRLTQGG